MAKKVSSRSAQQKTSAPAKAKRRPSTRGRSGGPAEGRLDAAAASIGRALGRTTAAIADHLPWGQPDGLTLLERDHRELEALLKDGIALGDTAIDGRRALLARLTPLLTTHEAMEEQVLYPALKAHPEAKDIVLEGYQEHHVADVVLKELQELPPSDERWAAKLKVLKESLEHHIEEEEGDMFKKARAAFGKAELDDIGRRMQALKKGM